jgi:hypothetical protein
MMPLPMPWSHGKSMDASFARSARFFAQLLPVRFFFRTHLHMLLAKPSMVLRHSVQYVYAKQACPNHCSDRATVVV